MYVIFTIIFSHIYKHINYINNRTEWRFTVQINYIYRDLKQLDCQIKRYTNLMFSINVQIVFRIFKLELLSKKVVYKQKAWYTLQTSKCLKMDGKHCLNPLLLNVRMFTIGTSFHLLQDVLNLWQDTHKLLRDPGQLCFKL